MPSISAKWCLDENVYSAVNEDIFNTYCSLKHQANKGQQEKAIRMLQSRKIVSVKTLQVSFGIYIRGMIEKSYSTTVIPAVTYFTKYLLHNMPGKATCNYPVGLSGVCCHILALLLYLKHYPDTNEKILVVTCRQQPQKWHCRSKKGSIPMVSLNETKPKSSSMRKKDKKIKLVLLTPTAAHSLKEMYQKLF